MRSFGHFVFLSVLLLAGSTIMSVSQVYGAGVQDCLDIDVDSCDFKGFSSMCQQLFSNPQPCDKLCRGIISGEDVGTCVICCSSVKSQLNIPQIYQVEPE